MPFAASLQKRSQPALMASDGAGASALPGFAGPPPDERQASHRGRLFRKYLLLILSLVTIALLASGGIGFYFSYEENREALASLQHEKAIAAASRIEQYVTGIEQQLKYAALPQLGSAEVELRRIEFLKLLRQVPEITDIAQLDSSGRERVLVSRLGMDSINSGKDRSDEAAFRGAKRGRTWFGPVYFRKETEPYLTIALRSNNDEVTVADVNLKFIWDVVSRIKIGEKGKAYVVDASGFLVADPDIGLVLRKTNLGGLPQAAGSQADHGGGIRRLYRQADQPQGIPRHGQEDARGRVMGFALSHSGMRSDDCARSMSVPAGPR